MSCCNNTFPCGSVPSFKVHCTNPCNGLSNSNPSDEVNYLELLFNPSTAVGAIPSNTGYYIPYNTRTVVSYNTLLEQYGPAISPNLTTGVITVVESGLYDVSYSVGWNSVNYTSTGSASTGANNYREVAIIVNNATLTSFDQIYGNISNQDNIATSTNPVLSQSGDAIVLLSEGDTISIVVRQRGVTSTGANGVTNLVSSVTAGPVIVSATKLQIRKIA
jgi:hypothetical protein